MKTIKTTTQRQPSTNETGTRLRHLLGLFAATAALSVAVAACGSSDSSDSSSDGMTAGGDTEPMSYFQDNVDALFKGTFVEPDVGARPPEGKKVALVAYGLASSYAANFADGFEDAAGQVGWDVTVYDGKFNPGLQGDNVRSAIASGADGIVLSLIDCPGIESALAQAKEAGIPVVGIESYDCNQIDKGGQSLFASQGGNYNPQPFDDPALYPTWTQGFGKAQADAAIVHTDGQAKVLNMVETDAQGTIDQDVGFKEELAKCADCEIVDEVEFTGGDIGTTLQQKTAQALVQNPDANVVTGVYDAPVTGGIAAAVNASGRADEIYVTGGEGTPPNIELIRSGKGQSMGVGLASGWEAYAAVDQLGRIFSGEPDPEALNGIGYQIFDADNNLPPEGEGWTSPFDYESAYLEGWGIK